MGREELVSKIQKLKLKVDQLRHTAQRQQERADESGAQHNLVKEAGKAGISEDDLRTLMNATQLLKQAHKEGKITKWQMGVVVSLAKHIIAGFGSEGGWLRPQHVAFDLLSSQVGTRSHNACWPTADVAAAESADLPHRCMTCSFPEGAAKWASGRGLWWRG